MIQLYAIYNNFKYKDTNRLKGNTEKDILCKQQYEKPGELYYQSNYQN